MESSPFRWTCDLKPGPSDFKLIFAEWLQVLRILNLTGKF
jgi:hypothetical protein